MSNAIKLQLLGQSVWYDNVSRRLINDGSFKKMIEQREIYGVTSNPTIFDKAIRSTKDYDANIQTMSWAGLTPKEIFYQLAIQDIRDVADLLRPYYDASNGADGYVSLEVDPRLAYETQATIDEVKWVWKQVDRPNLMVKIPATKEGLPAITEAIASGINVNVTLIFSIKRYDEVMDAYLAGLEKRAAAGKDLSGIASVASFFVSRLESIADAQLDQYIQDHAENSEIAKSLKGKIAVANTRLAYQSYERKFNSSRFKVLEILGAKEQRPLWASTSTKNPDYYDIKYVQDLIAENTVNTIPPETLKAFLDHGNPEITIHNNLEQARLDIEALEALGISMDMMTKSLEEQGVQKFEESFAHLLTSIETQQSKFLKQIGPLVDIVHSKVMQFKNTDLIAKMDRNDPTLWTNDKNGKDEIQKRLGWLELPFEGERLIQELSGFYEQCKKDGIEQILLLGMGGSSLAPETMQLILREKIDGLSLKILDSTIPEQVLVAEKWVDFKKTLFVVASKSGSTTETMEMFNYFWAKAEDFLGEERQNHFIAITDPGSSLMQLGQSLNFRSVFTSNPNVGGRYSALSHFGLVPAVLMGIDLQRFLVPAQSMADLCAQSAELESNLGALLGIIIGTGAVNGKDKLTFLTDGALEPIGAWLEQLVAESSGKQGRGIVPIVDEPCLEAENYNNDRLFVYLRNSGEMDSFVKELLDAEQPVVTIDVKDTYEIGAQFYLWEIAVAVACIILEVNAFDQPNVQDSKDRTKQQIAVYIEKGELDEPKPLWQKDQIKVFGVSMDGIEKCLTIKDVVDRFINLAKRGDYIAINAYVPRNETNIMNLTDLRDYILHKTNLATTLGFGPRFQHSTGQLHKGGANNGLFLQITQDDAIDLDIPGKPYSFGILAKAQAQGDLDALLAKDRRVLRIHVNNPDQIAKLVA